MKLAYVNEIISMVGLICYVWFAYYVFNLGPRTSAIAALFYDCLIN